MINARPCIPPLLAMLLLSIPAMACAQGPSTSPSHGRQYTSPPGNYTTVFTFDTSLGARIDEHYFPGGLETVVSDDFGGWQSIAFMRLSQSTLPVSPDAETLKTLLDYYLNAFTVLRITPVVPKTKILHREYLRKDTAILFAVFDLKGGSNMTINGAPDDAIRGVFVVIQGAYAYTIATQVSTGTAPVYKTMTAKSIRAELGQKLNELYGRINFQTDLEVGRTFVAPAPTARIPPDLLGYVPDMKLSDGLFFPDAGTKRFDTLGKVLVAKGDWVLYQSGLESILPVPKGWKTIETGQETYVMFSPSGDEENNPTIKIRLGAVGHEGDSTSIDAVIQEYIESAKSDDKIAVLKREIVDKDRGYFVLRIRPDAKTVLLALWLFASNVSHPGGFDSMMAVVDEKNWGAYYPVIRAMGAHWYARDGVLLGVALPEALVK